MKALLPMLVLLIVCGVLFVTGVLSPRPSKRMQQAYGDASKKAEEKSNSNGGRVGDIAGDALEKGRHAAEGSGRAGRRVNKKLPGKRKKASSKNKLV